MSPQVVLDCDPGIDDAFASPNAMVLETCEASVVRDLILEATATLR